MWNGKSNSKYYSHKIKFKGIEFDSKYEMEHYMNLLHQQRNGKISGLRLQKEFVIIPQLTKLVPEQLKTKVRYNKMVVEQDARYTCDFVYKENDTYYMVEFKSEETAKLQDYILRRKLMMQKIYKHNYKGRSKWVFREVVKYKNGKITITDK